MLFSPVLWLVSGLIASIQSSNIVCPDSSHCPDTATCCQLANKSYGCCPLQDATCCDDHIHCCPKNSKCDAGICIQLDGINATAKILSTKDSKDSQCFGSEYYCPDWETCCKGKEPGTYGCCPLKHAVCCSDGYRCCPKDTVCQISTGMCVGNGYISEMYDSQKIKSRKHDFAKYLPLSKPNNTNNVICPGSTFQCPNGYTCCQLPSGDWGCCPFVNATCCKDHLHCCPQNMQCDATSKACSQGHVSVPSLQKELTKPVKNDIICPDNSTCAESMTCCMLQPKKFGCCPYKYAVCCQDLSHCCPHGFICDIEKRRCIPNQKWLYNVVSEYYKKLD